MNNFENIYDIRKGESLLYVLCDEFTLGYPDVNILKQVVVAFTLYYTDTIEYYLKYINNIPDDINVYIISSVPEIWKKIELYRIKRKNIILLKKENRGRDISGLLVVFREIALNYKYVCYVHDKKEKNDFLKQDIKKWIQNLWENTLASKEYIYNVINKFEENDSIGLLVPPEPIGEYMNTWFINLWADDFGITKQLANKLGLKCNLDIEKPPITIGTVFWARTKALRKLFAKEWKYDDFPEEPLAIDGTINHAIERILGYISQDAGFKTGTIMTSTYAANTILYQQDILNTMGQYMREKESVYSVHQMRCLQKQKEKFKEFFKKNKEVYLYGTGVYGIRMLRALKNWGYEPKGFLVSDGYKKQDRIENLDVYEIREFWGNKNIGIIISVNYDIQKDICQILENYEFKNYMVGYI